MRTKKLLIVTAWVMVLSFVALTAATYAWMSIATSYKVSDLDVNIITENAMEIALDVNGQPGEWMKSISADQFLTSEATLRPVTWSAKDRAFYAPTYGIDGRINFFDPHLITSVYAENSTSSPAEAEGEDGAGYLISVDFWLRTGAAKIATYLSGPEVTEPDKLGDGTYVVGAPLWDAEGLCHISGGKGAENVIRIGFLTYDYVNPTDGSLYEEASMYIYEPNTTADEEVTNGLDGNPLQGSGKLIRQNPGHYVESDPPLRDNVTCEGGEFVGDDTEMFQLIANTPRKVTLFIWLEGQDVHCNNSISAGQILANLQIGATTKNNQQGIGRPEGGGRQ